LSQNHDLIESRSERKIDNIVIIRFEQLFPFIEEDVVKIMKKYQTASKFVWCQEEPRNMGAWKFIRHQLDSCLEKAGIKAQVSYTGRERSASPAVGYLYIHNKQQETLLEEAFEL
jgi:2-oxoglutarate dehydrogenase E1 component